MAHFASLCCLGTVGQKGHDRDRSRNQWNWKRKQQKKNQWNKKLVLWKDQ